MTRLDRLARRYAEAIQQYRAALANGDRDGAAYLAADARAIRRAMAGG
jgi:hypothetical protein